VFVGVVVAAGVTLGVGVTSGVSVGVGVGHVVDKSFKHAVQSGNDDSVSPTCHVYTLYKSTGSITL
jgi:hypothetical protein